MQQPIPKDFDPEKAENLEEIEMQFAVKAVEQSETYWTLLQKFGPKRLSLTKVDDELYNDLLATFPEFEGGKLQTIDENEMKSKTGKEKWRVFCNRYETKVPDFNFGTLLRLNAGEGYTQDNTMFAVRTQFYAVEIYRNRNGLNDWVYQSK